MLSRAALTVARAVAANGATRAQALNAARSFASAEGKVTARENSRGARHGKLGRRWLVQLGYVRVQSLRAAPRGAMGERGLQLAARGAADLSERCPTGVPPLHRAAAAASWASC
jgi:hypothetical protein